MKVKNLFALTLSLTLLFTCEQEVINFDDTTANIVISTQDRKGFLNNTYIIISQTNRLPIGLKNKLEDANGILVNQISGVGIALAQSNDPNFVENASKIRGLKAIVPNLRKQLINPEERENSVDVKFGNPPFSGDDDFYFDLQWGHDAVDAPEAWDAGYRGARVRVAVLDAGFDLDYPDLESNINFNLSKDFTGEGLDYTLDDVFSHGTHTAGTIAATDNAFGTIGIAPESELVLLKVLFDEGLGYDFDILNAIIYAAQNDVDVLNMSFGGLVNKNGEKGLYSARDAAEYAVIYNRVTNYAFQMGTTLIAAAGNENIDFDHAANWIHLPSNSANVISISATGPNGWALDSGTNLDLPAFYTNYGQKVIDFAAPGGNVDFNLFPDGPWYYDMVFSTGNSGWYWSAGTSMASPHAVGVAALIIGKNGGSMAPAQVEAALRASADDLGKPGKDDYYGNGRVNAFRAVNQ